MSQAIVWVFHFPDGTGLVTVCSSYVLVRFTSLLSILLSPTLLLTIPLLSDRWKDNSSTSTGLNRENRNGQVFFFFLYSRMAYLEFCQASELAKLLASLKKTKSFFPFLRL